MFDINITMYQVKLGAQFLLCTSCDFWPILLGGQS